MINKELFKTIKIKNDSYTFNIRITMRKNSQEKKEGLWIAITCIKPSVKIAKGISSVLFFSKLDIHITHLLTQQVQKNSKHIELILWLYFV